MNNWGCVKESYSEETDGRGTKQEIAIVNVPDDHEEKCARRSAECFRQGIEKGVKEHSTKQDNFTCIHKTQPLD